MGIIHRLSETRLNLFRHIEIVKDRHFARVLFNDRYLIWSNKPHIALYLFEDLFVVHINILVAGIEKVAQHGNGSSGLLIYELWSVLGLLHFHDGIHPTLIKDLQFRVEFCHPFSFRHGAYNDTAILRLDAVDELFESGSLFSALYLGRNIHLITKRYQHEIPACKTKFTGQSWSLCRNRLFDNLHQNLLANCQGLLYAAVFLQVRKTGCLVKRHQLLPVTLHLFEVLGIRVELIAEVKKMQESVALIPYINKTSIEARHELLYFRNVDVADREIFRSHLGLIFHKPFIFK